MEEAKPCSISERMWNKKNNLNVSSYITDTKVMLAPRLNKTTRIIVFVKYVTENYITKYQFYNIICDLQFKTK